LDLKVEAVEVWLLLRARPRQWRSASKAIPDIFWLHFLVSQVRQQQSARHRRRRRRPKKLRQRRRAHSKERVQN